ncbi:MAG: hypothetical protein ACFFDN_02875 [Candidatus Hodarchaeota archaeon]
MANILFKNKGFFYRDELTWDKNALKKLTKVKIILTTKELTFKSKDEKITILEIPSNQIKSLMFFTHPKDSTKRQYEIKLENKSKIYLLFDGGPGNFWSMMYDYILMPKFMKEGEKYAKEFEGLVEGVKIIKTISNSIYVDIPPKTKLAFLKCPACNAPLEYMPPCECVHCGVRIEIEGLLRKEDSIICSKCHTKIPKKSKYCLECGNTIKS